jgi:hypothetical protein
MRLSDRQYRYYTRTGFAITIVAALAFDRVQIGLQPTVLIVAVLGAAVGFFPLVTSRTFESQNQEDQGGEGVAISEVHSQPDSSVVSLGLDEHNTDSSSLSRRSLEVYLKNLYSAMNSNLGGREGAGNVYGLGTLNLNVNSYVFTSLEVQRERSQRVHEMHEIIHRMRLGPQAFSVELTSSNSIIVRCERMKESDLLDEVVKNWDYETESAEAAQRELVN